MAVVLQALTRAADNMRGGRPSAALLLNKSDEALRKELNGSTTHKMGAIDALAIARECVAQQTAHCYDYAHAVARECGGRFEINDQACVEGRTPVDRLSCLVRETSDVTTAVIVAMADHVITDNELVGIEREIAQAEAVLYRLRAAARAVNAVGKPGAVGALEPGLGRQSEVLAA